MRGITEHVFQHPSEKGGKLKQIESMVGLSEKQNAISIFLFLYFLPAMLARYVQKSVNIIENMIFYRARQSSKTLKAFFHITKHIAHMCVILRLIHL